MIKLTDRFNVRERFFLVSSLVLVILFFVLALSPGRKKSFTSEYDVEKKSRVAMNLCTPEIF
ncbi:hypothetical protein [Salinimicrobium sp. HB62]|uniref:hypothetical protein n=1 Tax=Salinimicrobium sp. HB62 TaxID=3077781 RepID=UPI002D7927C1|nr:hypothetical protein [Salinimicrobium sp. HB62]